METKLSAKDEQCYEDFEPLCQWKKDEAFHILVVHLPGFKRQDVRVQINNRGILTISGKQPMDEETTFTPSRFHRAIKISEHCNASGIHAKFSRGILSITMPKKVQNHSKESAGFGSGEKTETAENAKWWPFNYYLLCLRRKTLRTKLSKEIALGTVVGALAMALGGYAVYRYSKSATVPH